MRTCPGMECEVCVRLLRFLEPFGGEQFLNLFFTITPIKSLCRHFIGNRPSELYAADTLHTSLCAVCRSGLYTEKEPSCFFTYHHPQRKFPTPSGVTLPLLRIRDVQQVSGPRDLRPLMSCHGSQSQGPEIL